jgi:hypothetical protein
MERPVDRHRGDTGNSSGGGLESFLGQQQLLPYAAGSAPSAPSVPQYSVQGLVDEWFCAPQMQTERCGCGGNAAPTTTTTTTTRKKNVV